MFKSGGLKKIVFHINLFEYLFALTQNFIFSRKLKAIMKTKVFNPVPLRPDDFIFIYNGQEIKISKYQFALYSTKFRRIPEFFVTNQMEVHDDPPFNVFNQFLRAAQGDEVNVTVDNALDFLHFCDVWEVDSVATEVKKVINANRDIQATVQKYLDARENDSLVDLEEIIASNFDSALQMVSLTEFPIESLLRIVNNPKCEIKKPLRYYRFVKQLLNRVGTDASLLASRVDITRLSPEEAYEFLKNPKLNKSFIADSLSEAALNLIQENSKLLKQLNDNRSLLTKLSSRLDTLETSIATDPHRNDFNESMNKLKKKIDKIENKIGISSSNGDNNSSNGGDKTYDQKLKAIESKIEKLCNDTIEKVNQKYVEVEAKAHKDLRKTNKIVNGLTKKSGALDESISQLHTDGVDIKNTLATILRKVIDNEELLQTVQDSIQKKENEKESKTKNQNENKIKEIKNKPSNSVQMLTLEYNGQPYNGILSKLTELAEGNVHTKGVVNITASTSDHNEPFNVADFGWNDCFFTESRPSSWLMLDFLDKRISVTNYTIKTHKYKAGTCHLKAWIIEGSVDCNTWEEIDRRSTPVLNGPNKMQTFPASSLKNSNSSTGGRFRYVRLRQTGANCKGNYILALSNIEFFGTIFY